MYHLEIPVGLMNGYKSKCAEVAHFPYFHKIGCVRAKHHMVHAYRSTGMDEESFMRRAVAESYARRLRDSKGKDFWRSILGDLRPRESYEPLVVEAKLVCCAEEAERCVGVALSECDPGTVIPLRRSVWQPPDEGNAYWHFAGASVRIFDKVKSALDQFCRAA